MKASGFDAVSWYYDVLARLVFQGSIPKAQTEFLHRLPPSNILVMGGGTGWILPEIFKAQPQAVVWYVEVSQKMIAKAQAQPSRGMTHFIHGTEDDIPSGQLFDAVITPFFLDVFTLAAMDAVIRKIDAAVHPSGLWIVSEFQNKKTWHRVMLWIMYRFFRFAASIDAAHLADWEESLQRAGWVRKESKEFYAGFIDAAVFQRNP
ncbi:MAG: class I SAM-dependent methyltransferase [Cytophagales bacterium]|nr:class I SAM-dependent methyltransferase [Cytophagales bacterium]